jgi:phosphotransferase system, enzyme I, PtsP
MDIQEHLVQLAKDGGTLAELVRSTTRAMAEDLSLDACYIFLYRQAGELVLESYFGNGSNRASSELVQSVAGQALATFLPTYAESSTGTLFAVPMISRGHRIGSMVVERAGRRQAFSEGVAASVSTAASQMVDLIVGARAIQVIEGAAEVVPESLTVQPSVTQQRTLSGTAASPGIAIGVAAFRQVFPHQLVRRDSHQGELQTERDRLRDAFQKTQNDLTRMQSAAAGELGEDQALIFTVQLLLLRDPMLKERIEQAISGGGSAAVAVDVAANDIIGQFKKVKDPYIQERSDDVEDLRSRLLGHLLDVEHEDAQGVHVVVSPRTTPSIIMELKARGALGVASELDGTTSHGVLLARALGVPAVTGVSGLLELVQAGDLLIIDGDEGEVILRPTPDTIAEYTKRGLNREHVRTEFLAYRRFASKTADGFPFKLHANIALGIDLDVARHNGAQGVGLYRTEFPFIAREGVPTRDEQVRIYAKAYQAFPQGPICFRILDLAGDKLLGSVDLGIARNPFHGYRSMRVLFDYPHILRDQVQAFALAAGDRPLRILVPMVGSLEELRQVKALVAEALADLPSRGQSPSPIFGAMIEVPAAVEIVGDLAAEVDFFSIGTNDLIQYALVVDREDPRLASPRNAFHPAILRMIRRAVNAAHESGKEISVCGEMAAQPELALILIALGVDTLSVTPRAIPELKYRLVKVRLASLAANVNSLLASATIADIEQALRRYLIDESEPPIQPRIANFG